MLKDVIASLCVDDNSESDDDYIQCQPVINAVVEKILSLLHQFMAKYGCNEKSLYTFDVCKCAVDLCIAESECQTTLDEFSK